MTIRPSPRSDPPLQGLRILVVDDDDLCREVAKELLEAEGARIIEATNGAQAVAVCLAPDAALDLVLMDNEMPLLGGLPATQTIRARHSAAALPVIGLSSRCDMEDRRAAMSVGMNDYLPKPFDIAQVVAAILRHRRSPICAGQAGQPATQPRTT